jgi:ATP:corrinoid adenosyltransferase
MELEGRRRARRRLSSRALIEAVDPVTEMREVKHPLHTQGLHAQKGIEF